MEQSNYFWICPKCGQQVWANVIHICEYSYGYYSPDPQTIESKLDKIIELLEKLLSK